MNRLMHLAALAAMTFSLQSAPAFAHDHDRGHNGLRGDYDGTFQIAFGAGPAGQDVLDFGGDGWASHLGLGTVSGHSLLTTDPTNPLCSNIVEDSTVLASDQSGDQLNLHNEGQDCLDFTSQPGQTLIHSTATYTITGGTGQYRNATGTGTVKVDAVVTGPGGAPNIVVGTFDLTVRGTLDIDRRQGHVHGRDCDRDND